MIQIYTGDGKGKTTAGIGLAVRASATLKVLYVQLIKDGKSSEIEVLKKISNITVVTFGSGKRIYPAKDNKEEKELIGKGISYICENYDNFDLIVIDEAVTAVSLGLLEEEALICLVGGLGKEKEIVLTGHNASEGLIEAADLVTEVKKIKHYYDQGQKARKGIEF